MTGSKTIKAKLEALIYAAEAPVTLDQLALLLKEDLLALKAQAQQNHEDAGQPDSGAPPDSEAQPNPEAPRLFQQDTEPPAVPAAAGEAGGAAAGAARARRGQKLEKAELRELLHPFLEEMLEDSTVEDRGIEVREVAGGYRMSTKPEHHDVVRAFAKSLKPPIRLSLPALETLAVIAYKQPVTAPEISDIRGVDTAGVLGTLLQHKLITTAGRKAVVGRPMLYKTTRDFLIRFGLKDLNELPSLEEFEKLAVAELEGELPAPPGEEMPLLPGEDVLDSIQAGGLEPIQNVQLLAPQVEAEQIKYPVPDAVQEDAAQEDAVQVGGPSDPIPVEGASDSIDHDSDSLELTQNPAIEAPEVDAVREETAPVEGTGDPIPAEFDPDSIDPDSVELAPAAGIETPQVEAHQIKGLEVDAMSVEAVQVEGPGDSIPAEGASGSIDPDSLVELAQNGAVEAAQVEAEQIEALEVEAVEVEAAQAEAPQIDIAKVEGAQVESSSNFVEETKAPEPSLDGKDRTLHPSEAEKPPVPQSLLTSQPEGERED